MVRNKKVYITIIGKRKSSTKKIHSNYVLYNKILEKYVILLNSIFIHVKKIRTQKNYASNIYNCLSGWKWIGYLTFMNANIGANFLFHIVCQKEDFINSHIRIPNIQDRSNICIGINMN